MSELPWESGKNKPDRSADANPPTPTYPWETNDPDKAGEPATNNLPDLSNIEERTPLDIDADTIHILSIEPKTSNTIKVIDVTNEKILPDGLSPDFQKVIPTRDSDGTFQASSGAPLTIKTDKGKAATLPLFEPKLPDENTGAPHVETVAQQGTNEQDPFKQIQPAGMETVAQHDTIEQDPFKQMQPTEPETFAQQGTSEQDPFKQMQQTGEEGTAYLNPDQSSIFPSVSDKATNVSNIINNLKGFLKKVTYRKKLIERVEDMREALETQEIESVSKEEPPVPVPTSATTSTAPPTFVPLTPPTLPSEPVPEDIEKEDIRTVISIPKEVVEKQTKELADGTSPFAQFNDVPNQDEIETIDMEKGDICGEVNVPEPAPAEQKDEEIPSDVSPNAVNILKEELGQLKEDLERSHAYTNDIQDNVRDITGNVVTMQDSVESLETSQRDIKQMVEQNIGPTSERVSLLDSRITDLENTLVIINTDKTDLKNILNNVEQNISELADSYTFIVSQIQETNESNNSKFAELSLMSKQLETMQASLTDLEGKQQSSQDQTHEFTNTVTTLISNVAEVHTTNEGMKKEIGSLTDFVEKELQKIGARSYRSRGEDIQLTNIMKNSASTKLCMEWLEFLMELVGRNNLSEILSYYEELGWINDEVRMELMRYAEGIDYYIEKPDWKLTPDDHVKSIWFVEKLAGARVDKNRLSIIERDIKKVKSGAEIYGI
ncbi:MAG: FlaD/FlaE family flagellar protein [Euryarchaeota archaeon]|nr:FlaD/FlaE family flagellar protein [Euryarchaeota archaeon]